MSRFLLLRRLSALLTATLLVASVAQAGPPPIPLAAVPCTTEPNVNRAGQDYASMDVPPNPSVCRIACENDPQCRAYTYVRPGVQGPSAKCWLKNGVPPAQPDANCVSGVKQLGPPPGPTPTPAPFHPAPAGEDCIAFDSNAVSVAQIGGRWKVVQGSMLLLDFGSSQPQARQALQVIQHYGMDSQCFVGRPNAPMQYYLVNGAAPSGSLPGQDCIPFNPAQLRVQRISGRWKVVEGSHSLLDFGASQANAQLAYDTIMRYGFTQVCYVGRPGLKFMYFLSGGAAPPPPPTAPVNVTANVTADPPNYSGPCPGTITFRGAIAASGPCDVSYKFIRSDGATAPVQALHFAAAGSRQVNETWTIGMNYSGWEAIQILSPAELQSNQAPFQITCGAAPPPPPAPSTEDCIQFDPNAASVTQIGGRWKVVVGDMWLLDFGGNEAEARQALQIIQSYGLTSQCFVGRPNPPMEYYLVNGSAPSGALAGEDCVAFNPAAIQVQLINGTWKIVEGSHWILDFAGSQANAQLAFDLIQKYGFTHICFVGRPNPPMTYFRR